MLVNNTGVRPRKSYKDNDFYIATRNVLRLYRAGMLKQVKTELQKYIIDITAIQKSMEGKWNAGYRKLHIEVQW
jgi:hypothetical protein